MNKEPEDPKKRTLENMAGAIIFFVLFMLIVLAVIKTIAMIENK